MLWCVSVVGVFAQTGINLVTSPLPINLVTTPGSTVSAQIKVKNGGTETDTFELGLMKFSAYGDDGQPRLIDRDVGDDYFDWVTFSEKEFELNPNEWKTITVYFNVPETAAFGYYYAVTFSKKNEIIPEGPRSTKVTGSVASLILLEVRVPNAIREIEVLEFSSPKLIYEFLPTKFNITLKNKGNVHVAPRGNIFIEGMGKKDLVLLNINDLKGNILPNSKRVFETEWTEGFPVYVDKVIDKTIITDRSGKSEKKLNWDFSQISKFRFGKFTAHMLLVYDDGNRDIPVEAELKFWIIPWRILMGVTFVIGLMLLGLYSVVILPIKNLKNRVRNKRRQ